MSAAVFTVEELDASKAWAPSRTGDTYNVLNNPALHPLVEKTRWTSTNFYLHQAPIPIRQGTDGYWEVCVHLAECRDTNNYRPQMPLSGTQFFLLFT